MTRFTEQEIIDLWHDGLITDEEFDEAIAARRERDVEEIVERLSYASAGRGSR
jgi:hypothetical protein